MAGGVNSKVAAALLEGKRRWPYLHDPGEVAYRASMLPVGNYEDGSVAFPVWPQIAVQAKEAFGRFGRGENPQAGDEVLAFMTPGIAGAFGLGSRAVRGSVAGAERATSPSGIPFHGVETGRVPAVVQRPRPLASIKIGDTIYDAPPGGNHGDAYILASEKLGQRAFDKLDDDEIINGFTYGGKFLTRDEASRLIGKDAADSKMDAGALRKLGETLFSNAPDAAPVGLLATSGLERMAADDVLPRQAGAPSVYQMPDPQQIVTEHPGKWQIGPEDASARIQRLMQMARAAQRGEMLPATDPRGLEYINQMKTMLRPEFEDTTLHANPSSPLGLLPLQGGDDDYENNLPPIVRSLMGKSGVR